MIPDIVIYALAVLFLIGIWRPWWVFWFLAYKNRLTTLKYLGVPLAVCLLVKYFA